jgi:hypothetical protein
VSDALDPAFNPYIGHTDEGHVILRDQLVSVRPSMNVQLFLEQKKSGLAKVSWRYGTLNIYKTTAAEWIQKIAERYRIRPEFILTVLQSEQGLVSDPQVREVKVDIIALPDKTEAVPTVPIGYSARRNGGYWDDRNKNMANWTKRVSDGNWWLAVKGDWKMIAATGAGIPDPNRWPPWDVRKYFGLGNQIESVGKLVEKYYTEYNEAVRKGDLAARTIKLYDGRLVVAGDPETYTVLKWTPSAEVLVQRPKISKSFSTA